MRTGIALGSNVGDRLEHLRTGRDQILLAPGVAGPILSSSVYETERWVPTQGPSRFSMRSVEVEFRRHASELLDALQRIEAAHGRPSKRPRNAPRTLDLDILYVGNLVLSNQEVVIPHPRLHLRRFVLTPLADIRPELVLPGQHRSIAELLAGVEDSTAVERKAAVW
jgi:2-amino-4-hydroxy-6-hydroxymethyldihydropteridine diphosphokinase